MCNILILPQGVMPKREAFENMCYNNWHSWGLVTRIDGKLDILKKVPASGEIDADEIEVIWKLLERDIEFERILHVRHNTAGATNEDNCHPIDVYYDQKTGRQVVFMHNGTMYEYKSKKQKPNTTGGYTLEDDPDGPSDTKNFVDQILTPMLTTQNYGNGHGDINNKFFVKLANKMWPLNNRGLIISNDQNLLLLGEWKKTKAKGPVGSAGEVDIWSSNDDYFDKVQRGPEYDRRVEREKKAREAEQRLRSGTATGTSNNTIYPLSEYNFNRHSIYSLSATLDDICDDWSRWNRECAVYLGAASMEELEELYKNKEVCIEIMDWTFQDYYHLFDEYNDLEAKLERQATYINSIHGKLRAAGVEKDILEMTDDELKNIVTLNKKAA